MSEQLDIVTRDFVSDDLDVVERLVGRLRSTIHDYLDAGDPAASSVIAPTNKPDRARVDLADRGPNQPADDVREVRDRQIPPGAIDITQRSP